MKRTLKIVAIHMTSDSVANRPTLSIELIVKPLAPRGEKKSVLHLPSSIYRLDLEILERLVHECYG